ncbi:MAG: glutamate mutase L [Methanosarcinaceae archaeon]|nr:glutamate mutase L [Methanosarcinaceae archaeon]
MTGWFTPDEAAAIRTNHPDVILLAGLTDTRVWLMIMVQHFLKL